MTHGRAARPDALQIGRARRVRAVALFADVSGFLGNTHECFRAHRHCTDELRGWSLMQSRSILR